MIHHISIPAHEPLKVAKVLQKVTGGKIVSFKPLENGYMLFFGDDYGSALEIYPANAVLTPGDKENATKFAEIAKPRYMAVHAAISCDKETPELVAIAEEQGWHAAEFRRGSFSVVEFWVENEFMIEFLTPQMAVDYLKMAKSKLES